MDPNGYPDEAELEQVKSWPHTDLMGLMAFIQGRWWPAHGDCWKIRGRHYSISTWGWSGNESLVEALQQNRMFWALCWQSSKRGGHYTFELPRQD